jgi:hypothetical protein
MIDDLVVNNKFKKFNIFLKSLYKIMYLNYNRFDQDENNIFFYFSSYTIFLRFKIFLFLSLIKNYFYFFMNCFIDFIFLWFTVQILMKVKKFFIILKFSNIFFYFFYYFKIFGKLFNFLEKKKKYFLH